MNKQEAYGLIENVNAGTVVHGWAADAEPMVWGFAAPAPIAGVAGIRPEAGVKTLERMGITPDAPYSVTIRRDTRYTVGQTVTLGNVAAWPAYRHTPRPAAVPLFGEAR